MTVANSPAQLFIFGIFEHKWGTRKHIDDLKKYSWCIPVQKEIKPIIWGAAITPEPWNRQQCWFIFEDPNVRVARLLESLATINPPYTVLCFNLKSEWARLFVYSVYSNQYELNCFVMIIPITWHQGSIFSLHSYQICHHRCFNFIFIQRFARIWTSMYFLSLVVNPVTIKLASRSGTMNLQNRILLWWET